MAVKRFYLVNGVDANGWQALSESTQSAVNCNAGWVVGTGGTLHSELAANTERASTTFTGTTVPDGSLDTTLKDACRIPSALSGAFASGNWTLQFAVQSPVQGGAADGRIRFRLIKANADGSSATEITAAQQQASAVSNVTTSDANSSLTFNPGTFRLDNQYLFVQVAWERTGAGGMSTTNIRLRTGSAATPTGTVITTADWTPDSIGTATVTLADATVAATAVIPSLGTAALTLEDAAVSGSGTVATPSGFPQTAVLDDFNRADDFSTSGVGANWTISANFFNPDGAKPSIYNNTMAAYTANHCYINVQWNVATYGPNCEVYVTYPVLPTHDNIELMLRESADGQDSYRLFWITSSGDLQIVKIIDGTPTVLQTVSAFSMADGDGLGFRAVGTTLQGFHYDGSSWNQTPVISATDGDLTGAGYLGLYGTSNSGGALDPWQADNFGGGTITAGAAEGDLAVTLEAATLTATAQLAAQASATVTLDAATVTSTASLASQGTAALTLDAATLSASGTVAEAPVVGTAAITLDAATLTADAQLAAQASATVTLDAAMVTSTASLASQATAALTLDAATVTSTASLASQATAALTLDAATLTSDATVAIQATATVTLADATVSAEGGAPAILADAAITLDAATLSASGTVVYPPIVGTAALTLEGATLTADAQLAAQASATVTLAAATLTADAQLAAQASATVTLAAATVTSTASLASQGTAALTLADATLSATGGSAMGEPREVALTATAALATYSLVAEAPASGVSLIAEGVPDA